MPSIKEAQELSFSVRCKCCSMIRDGDPISVTLEFTCSDNVKRNLSQVVNVAGSCACLDCEQ